MASCAHGPNFVDIPYVDVGNDAFSPDVALIGDASLTSPTISVPSGPAALQLSFKHFFDLENRFDGAVLEISFNAGPFVDIIDAGGSFVTTPYNGVISTAFGNPIGGRSAWTGQSGTPDPTGALQTVVNLPATAAGKRIQLRWRIGCDNSNSATGWRIDTISLVRSGVIDRDGDGIPDGWESAHGLNPDDPGDANVDSDRDGMSNLEEYVAGTDPHDPQSALRIASVERDASTGYRFLLAFPSVAGRVYQLEVSFDLFSWFTSQDNIVGTGNLLQVIDPPNVAQPGNLRQNTDRINATGSNSEFFRLRVSP